MTRESRELAEWKRAQIAQHGAGAASAAVGSACPCLADPEASCPQHGHDAAPTCPRHVPGCLCPRGAGRGLRLGCPVHGREGHATAAECECTLDDIDALRARLAAAERERDDARAALSIARRLLALPHLARCERYGCGALATKGGGAAPWSAWTSCDAHAGLLTGVVEELPQAADVRAITADDAVEKAWRP